MTPSTSTGVTTVATHECWELLRSTEVGRLAVIVDGRPDIFPINFVVDHGTVVFRTAAGTKWSAAVSGQPVAFEVDGFDATTGEAWSVVLHGVAKEVKRVEDLIDTTGLPLFPWQPGPKSRFVRVEPEVVTGRRFAVVTHEAWATPFDGLRATEAD